MRLAGAAAIATLAAVAFRWAPGSLPLPPCAFRSWTGLGCLTCGLTRSVHAMAHGDVAAAVGWHPIGPVLFLAGAAAGIFWGIEAVAGRPIRVPSSRATARIALVTIGVLWIGFWLARMVLEAR